MPKFIFVTGGVLSGIGKGHTTASIAKLLQFRGYEVDLVKIDPYLNVDPGTLNPVEHGEPFITDQIFEFNPAPSFRYITAEVDQDFGTYERFIGRAIHPRNNITSGQIYLSVILQERLGKFLGKTVQIIPHITDEIKRRLVEIAKAGKRERNKLDVIMVEIGGTVGDIEADPFLEAIRQFRLEQGSGNTLLVHVTLVPLLATVGEMKTKPTQHSVKQLLSRGLQPDIIIARSESALTKESRRKIALYSNVLPEAVISNPDLKEIYELPLKFYEQGLDAIILQQLEMIAHPPTGMQNWEEVVNRFLHPTENVRIAMPGKYVAMADTYVSIYESLRHAGAHLGAATTIEMVDAEQLEQSNDAKDQLLKYDGILLTPGFGTRGTEGMIRSAWIAVEEDLPYLGICFGAQLLFVALCRYGLGMKKANSTELDPKTPYPVVDLLPEQREIEEKGGTMRLAGHPIRVLPKTKLHKIYKKSKIRERFRHRYHLMWEPAKRAQKEGLIVSATDLSGKIINAIELTNRYWVVGTQFHPEYTSRPDQPNPLYLAFIDAILKRKHAIGQGQ
ncbi:MAG: CTP synthase [Candidatus Odinarchaeota archaeon]